jgi:hypothetical protein
MVAHTCRLQVKSFHIFGSEGVGIGMEGHGKLLQAGFNISTVVHDAHMAGPGLHDEAPNVSDSFCCELGALPGGEQDNFSASMR